jgi:hypothetical protein
MLGALAGFAVNVGVLRLGGVAGKPPFSAARLAAASRRYVGCKSGWSTVPICSHMSFGSAVSGRAESDDPNLKLSNHPTISGKAWHLEFEYCDMFLHSCQQGWTCAAERNSTQLCETVLSKSLGIEVAITSHKDALILERGHTNHWIG